MGDVSPTNQKVLQEIFSTVGAELNIKDFNPSTKLEFNVFTTHTKNDTFIQIDTDNPDIMGFLNVKTGVLDIINTTSTDPQNNSKSFKRIHNGPVTNEAGEVLHHLRLYYGLYYDGKREFAFRGGEEISRDIDFEQVQASAAANYEQEYGKCIIGKEIKYNGSTKQAYETTSYNFTVDGKAISFATCDNERIYVWANLGDGAKFTGQSFLLKDIDNFKLDVPSLVREYENSKSLNKNSRPYDISSKHMQDIKVSSSANKSWGGKYNGDMNEVMEAITFAAKEAGVNPDHLASFIEHESGFNPNAKSRTGAEGLGQFTTKTWNYVVHGIVDGKKQGYTVERNGEKYDCLSDAYSEFDWGAGTTNRNEVVVNAIATAHYMSNNMERFKTDDRNIGYIAHNIGGGGCNQFLKKLESSPNEKCSGVNLIEHNPTNYTNNGVPLTYKEAYNKIKGHLDNSLGMAVNRGYEPDKAKEAIEKNTDKGLNHKVSLTDSVRDELQSQGVKPYRDDNATTAPQVAAALAQVQSQGRGASA